MAVIAFSVLFLTSTALETHEGDGMRDENKSPFFRDFHEAGLIYKSSMSEFHTDDMQGIAQKVLADLAENWTLPHGASNCKTSNLIVDVGLPRTGTTSYASFMGNLGFASQHIVYGPKKDFDDFRAAGTESGKCPGKDNYFMQLTHLNQRPGEKYAYCDVPFFGLASSIAKCYPDAKMISLERDFDDWFRSFQFMFCTWYSCSDLAKGSNHASIQAAIYGDGINQICATGKPKMCKRGGVPIGDWSKVTLSMKKFYNDHLEEIKRLGAHRVLRVRLDDTQKAEKIAGFLGCGGSVPLFDHRNAANSR